MRFSCRSRLYLHLSVRFDDHDPQGACRTPKRSSRFRRAASTFEGYSKAVEGHAQSEIVPYDHQQLYHQTLRIPA